MGWRLCTLGIKLYGKKILKEAIVKRYIILISTLMPLAFSLQLMQGEPVVLALWFAFSVGTLVTAVEMTLNYFGPQNRRRP